MIAEIQKRHLKWVAAGSGFGKTGAARDRAYLLEEVARLHHVIATAQLKLRLVRTDPSTRLDSRVAAVEKALADAGDAVLAFSMEGP